MVMIMTNVAVVKARLSEYLDRAARGERILICRHNKPVAELRAVEETRTKPRPIGPLPGRPTFEIPASFFEPMSEDELEQWEKGNSTDPVSPILAPGPGRRVSRAAESTASYGTRRRRPVRRRS